MRWIVGVCSYDEESGLRAILPRLPKNSVFAVDGDAGGASRLLLSARKVLYSEERRGKSDAVNRILSYAGKKRVEAVVFVQADDEVSAGAFRALLGGFNDPKVGIVSAKVVPRNDPAAFLGFAAHLNWAMHNLFGELGRPKAGEMFAIRLAALKGALIPAGIINDDAWLQAESERNGFKTAYEPAAVVGLTGPKTVRDFLVQRRRIACGHFQLALSGMPVVTLSPSLRAKTFFRAAASIRQPALKTVIFSLGAAGLEMLATFLGFADHILGRQTGRWELAASTKGRPAKGDNL